MCFSVVCTLIDKDTHYQSGQNLLWTHWTLSLGCTSSVHNILTTVMTCMVIEKSTDLQRPTTIDLLILGGEGGN